MLKELDLGLTLQKEDYKRLVEPLQYKVNELEQECRVAQIPVVIVFEGWEAAGKGTIINRVMQCLDPRGFKVHSLHVVSREEKLRPYLWRFAIRMPARGKFAIFDKSWYRRVLDDRVEGMIPEAQWRDAFDEVRVFERQLVDDGYVFIKFWLHISQKEQKKRFRKMEKDPHESWKVTPKDWEQHFKYDAYLSAVEEMLLKTSIPESPWTLVEAEDKYFGRLKIMECLVSRLTRALKEKETQSQTLPVIKFIDDVHDQTTSSLKCKAFWDKIDLKKSYNPEKYCKTMDELQDKIRDLHHRMYLQRQGVVIVFQGWDAAGKGGAIRRLVSPLDPRSFEVIPISAPGPEEKAHHYLWRFWKELPKHGHLTIFDRSWYGRVIVERIEGFCSMREWQRAYHEINEFEKILIHSGLVLLKFWLHFDRDEQLKRFQQREMTPHKQWKITLEDWRNREKWELYEIAVADMIEKTSTFYAPWTIVESNDKLYSRIKVLETFIRVVEPVLNDNRPKPPLDV